MSPTLLERLRSWTETGIAAAPHIAGREIRESADEIARLRVELIKAWDCVNELRRGAQNLEHSLAAAINPAPPGEDLGPSHASLEVALRHRCRSN
jgi:hypothetical protein